MRKLLILTMLVSTLGLAQTPELAQARALYLRTDYRGALEELNSLWNVGAPAYLLAGQCHYMRGDFKKASEALEQAVRLSPGDSEANLWLGRAYGRRAETSAFFTAPGLASKARASFERSVELNPANKDAVGDLFEYYLEAPGLLGGGLDKATALAERFRQADPAEYYYRLALIADRRKDERTAEEQLRRAIEAAPQQLGRVLDLARFLAKQGRYQESEAAFRKAEQMAPSSPKLLFERARTYIDSKRNLDAARELLVRYLNSSLTPDDPPRGEAEQLLQRAGSS